jgi:hypothetical protein
MVSQVMFSVTFLSTSIFHRVYSYASFVVTTVSDTSSFSDRSMNAEQPKTIKHRVKYPSFLEALDHDWRPLTKKQAKHQNVELVFSIFGQPSVAPLTQKYVLTIDCHFNLPQLYGHINCSTAHYPQTYVQQKSSLLSRTSSLPLLKSNHRCCKLFPHNN